MLGGIDGFCEPLGMSVLTHCKGNLGEGCSLFSALKKKKWVSCNHCLYAKYSWTMNRSKKEENHAFSVCTYCMC